MTREYRISVSLPSSKSATNQIPNEIQEYSWKWFEYHAGQRLMGFRFYLLILAAFTLGYADAIAGRLWGVAMVVASFGSFASVAFLVLENRNNQLVDLGREALKKIEGSFACHGDEFKLVERASRRCRLNSYSFWLTAIYLVSAMLFLAAAIYPHPAARRFLEDTLTEKRDTLPITGPTALPAVVDL